VQAKTKDEMETEAVLGLTKGHAYAVTAIKKVRLAGTGVLGIGADKLSMIRLKNPWGPGSEWRGPFSDGCVRSVVRSIHNNQWRIQGAGGGLPPH